MFAFVRRNNLSRSETWRSSDTEKQVDAAEASPAPWKNGNTQKRRLRYFSLPFRRPKAVSEASHGPLPIETIDLELASHDGTEDCSLARPRLGRGRSHSCSTSNVLSNAFRQNSEYSSRTISHESLPDCSLRPENMRHVARQAPVVISPHGERAQIFFPIKQANDEDLLMPLADPSVNCLERVHPPASNRRHNSTGHLHCSAGTGMSRSVHNKRTSSRPGHLSIDYLQVDIPNASLVSLVDSGERSWGKV